MECKLEDIQAISTVFGNVRTLQFGAVDRQRLRLPVFENENYTFRLVILLGCAS